ncbi:hypothetical protein BKK80_08990 [Cupriavidus malaysiensis]|uniref:Uncharacterized protein n=1 Tax=Cupriavidus malaysiensis TaxID=367825 RepID=A0ABM6F3E8_9BURK|nr:hypothetical protein BKK80_08990 [Cupriavidus malaysiensis]
MGDGFLDQESQEHAAACSSAIDLDARPQMSAWPFQRIAISAYMALCAKTREDIEDYIEMKISKERR